MEGKDFVEAAKLEVGDKVVCYDAETDTTDTKEVESVHVYETDEPIMVYNIEVDVNHTYHVGEDGVLVHNTTCTELAEDVSSFGNKSGPRSARAQQDFGVNKYDDIVGPESGPLPKGASNVADISNSPLTGHYHTLPAGTKLPKGLGIIADGIDVISNSPHGAGHYTIFPTEAMTVDKFNELYKALPWQYGGKK